MTGDPFAYGRITERGLVHVFLGGALMCGTRRHVLASDERVLLEAGPATCWKCKRFLAAYAAAHAVPERTFTEQEVRQLLWLIGSLIPLNTLGDIYDRLEQWVKTDYAPDVTPLMRLARGTWNNAGAYGVGGPNDAACDLPKRDIW